MESFTKFKNSFVGIEITIRGENRCMKIMIRASQNFRQRINNGGKDMRVQILPSLVVSRSPGIIIARNN